MSSLRSERLTFLANVDNMNSMFDVARKLTRSVVGFVSCLAQISTAFLISFVGVCT